MMPFLIFLLVATNIGWFFLFLTVREWNTFDHRIAKLTRSRDKFKGLQERLHEGGKAWEAIERYVELIDDQGMRMRNAKITDEAMDMEKELYKLLKEEGDG